MSTVEELCLFFLQFRNFHLSFYNSRTFPISRAGVVNLKCMHSGGFQPGPAPAHCSLPLASTYSLSLLLIISIVIFSLLYQPLTLMLYLHRDSLSLPLYLSVPLSLSPHLHVPWFWLECVCAHQISRWLRGGQVELYEQLHSFAADSNQNHNSVFFRLSRSPLRLSLSTLSVSLSLSFSQSLSLQVHSRLAQKRNSILMSCSWWYLNE